MTLSQSRDGGVLTLALDDPDGGNRLDRSVLEDLEAALVDAGRDPELAVFVLTGAGADFCLGRRPSTDPVTPRNLEAEFGRIQRVNELIQSSPCVTIAAIRGRALGAGLSLAGRCDLVVAEAGARLAFPEIPHGIPPTIVLSHYTYALQRIPLMDLILTGREIDALEAQRVGLVSRVVADGTLEASVRELADQLLGYDREVIRTVKSFVGSLSGVSPAQAPSYGIAVYANAIVERAIAQERRRDA